MSGRERIAVTGIGLVSSLGFGRDRCFDALCAGERGIAPLTLFDASGLKSRIAAEVRGLDVRAVAPLAEAGEWSRSDALAFIAAREALAQAGHPPVVRLGLALGGTTGSMYETERALKGGALAGITPQDARRLLDFPLAMSVERLARALGAVGPSATVCSACSSGAVAIALGASWLLAGRADAVLVGGVDGLCQLTFTGFNALGAVDPEPCRPFDVTRAGLTLGEGAGCLVLELEGRARARGVPVIAFLSGWAIGSEAHHVTHPEPSGERASVMLQRAVAAAGLTPHDIDYVNAHGTGTLQNDAMEGQALSRVFAEDLQRVWVSSSKAQIGHTLGAAGAIEAAVTALSLNTGRLLPTAGLTTPELPLLKHVQSSNQRAPLRAALSNSFGFGGACAVLALQAPDTRAPRPRAASPLSVAVSGVASYGSSGVVSGLACSEPLDPGATSRDAPSDPLTLLDAERSRRFGRTSALVIATAESALRDAGQQPSETGFVVGSAFGDVERSVRFLQKVLGQGPKFASPAEFPQLIASTGSGNASIYLGLTGPCLSVSEFGNSGQCAVAVAISLLDLGLAPAVIAGAAEGHDAIVDLLLGERQPTPRGEGGGFLVLEPAPALAARGGAPLALITRHGAVHGSELEASFEALPAPNPRACVVTAILPSRVAEALGRSAWARVTRYTLPERLGVHEALGAVALTAAVAVVASGRAEEALVIHGDADKTYLTRLQRSQEPE